ncbi:hypothetical protein DAY19_03385 [Halobacteriovorax vibrionivorans]|uniref:Uncharacterized protein n=1 Tax=Halobacteriovorax vibrionivorans TaxID=2152716 RepID=A0ABY0IIN9_9BACT|nr:MULTISPECIES: hypothetical protein [Halobacteriovorax]RZF22829.1 hypothetical protein DAY19_03385 [Halobacteriovorax vibrionivorans]TGD47378.1 hypothetical protein EP118_08665 [Halobacteriovorax sp. Y22]
MACSGGHCSYHNTGTSTCSGHRGVCSSNRTHTLNINIAVGKIIYGSHVKALRDVISAEMARRRQHAMYNPGTPTNSYAAGTKITNSVAANMVSRLNQMTPNDSVWSAANPSPSDNRPKTRDDDTAGGYHRGTYGWNKTGQTIKEPHVQEILNYYNTLRADCICNTDCNCNAVCACHNNCGCHY